MIIQVFRYDSNSCFHLGFQSNTRRHSTLSSCINRRFSQLLVQERLSQVAFSRRNRRNNRRIICRVCKAAFETSTFTPLPQTSSKQHQSFDFPANTCPEQRVQTLQPQLTNLSVGASEVAFSDFAVDVDVIGTCVSALAGFFDDVASFIFLQRGTRPTIATPAARPSQFLF